MRSARSRKRSSTPATSRAGASATSCVARLESARRQLYPLLQQLREDADWKRWANVSVQEELALRAEKLVAETNLERAAAALRELERRWREAKEAPKDKGEALWTRFKAARDEVRAKVDAFLAKQAEEHASNLRKKQELCEKAEALAESSDWVKTAEALRALQAEWKASGPVAHAVSQRVWERFRKPCDQFFRRFQEHREERGREWEQNLAKKEALSEKAEALASSTLWEEAAAGIKQLQAEWRTIGPVKKSRADAVWQRFRAACDLFFDRYKNRDAPRARSRPPGPGAHLRRARGGGTRGGACSPTRPRTWWAACRRRRRPGARRAGCPRTRWRLSTSASRAARSPARGSTRAPSRAASSTPRRAGAAPRSSSRASRGCSRSSRLRRRARRRRRSTSRRACATRSPPTRSAAARRSSSAGSRPRTSWRRRRPPGGGSDRCPAPRAARSRCASRAPAGASPKSAPGRERPRAEGPRPERPRRDGPRRDEPRRDAERRPRR